MDERERSERRRAFGEAAQDYDAVRPGYPPRLVGLVIRRAGLGATSRVLEIGCGTGQLTRHLAPTGCVLVCLEPSPELAAVARRHLVSYPKAQVREERLEQFQSAAGAFDLAVAATSFHWVDPAVRCRKVHEALRPGGVVAILTHTHPGPWSGFFERVQDVYRALAPELLPEGKTGKTARWSDELADELAQSGLFEDLESDSERWERRLARDEYLALLNTFSPHRRLPEGRRRRLLAAIGQLIDAEWGGVVDQPYRTTLTLARKQPGSARRI